jgi:hypothetical protein
MSRLHDRVAEVRRLEWQVEARRRSWRAIAVIGSIAGLAAVGEWFFPGGTGSRTLVVLLWLAGAAAALVHASLPRLRVWGILAQEPLLQVARRAGASFPDVRDRLVNALQLGEVRVDAGWVSTDLTAESIRRLHDDHLLQLDQK